MAATAIDIAIEADGHAVQFYEHDAELAEAVGTYLAGGLSGDAAAVVIATAPHRRAFSAELEAAGLDPEQLSRAGKLVMLDARETLATFMPDGRMTRPRFTA